MAEKTADAIKYKILKFLDVTGFTVFDPMVRLAFGEEPKKQVKAILKFFVTPIIFICFCLWAWWVVAPNHKTKSGEVPTPDIVWQSAVINDTFSERERTKESDFLLFGEEREATLAEVETMIQSYGEELEELNANLKAQEEAHDAQLDKRITPIQAKLEALRDANKAAAVERTAALAALAEGVAAGNADEKELIAAERANGEARTEARDKESVYRDQIDAIRGEKFEPLESARLAVNAVADKIQFLKKRVDFLSDDNRSIKVAEAKAKLVGLEQTLAEAETGKKALSEAKKYVRMEGSISRLEEQQYASAMTVYLQIKRSLFTVFVGFFIAAFIAIPVGVLCGLNRIAMACLTPIISVFKPVSPVVWLLIFQIVVGAFFPDPESHPFFLFFNSLPLIGGLGINPALVFSACTVAMCAVWPALVNTALGVSSIDKDHINVARVLRLGFWDRLTKIIIPSALPLVFAGLRISLGVGWMVLIAAEALSSSDGLGKFVWDEYQNGSSFSFANILYACFVVGIIGFLLDRMMIVLQRFVSFDGGGTSL